MALNWIVYNDTPENHTQKQTSARAHTHTHTHTHTQCVADFRTFFHFRF